MKLVYCAIKDLAVSAFMTAGPQQSTAAAVRSFTDMINDPQSEVSKHPEDYELYELAAWDALSGQFLNASRKEEDPAGGEHEVFRPRLLVRGVDVVRSRQ